MKEKNLKKIIEEWVTNNFKGGFMYSVLFVIFIFLFGYIFYININMHSIYYLILLSFTPAFIVTFLSFLLFRESFLLFFLTLFFLLPFVVASLVVFALFIPVGSYGYVLYTNNYTNECEVRVLDYKKGMPWYTRKGCVLNNESKDTVRKYIQVGGGAMRWHDVCQELRLTRTEFSSDYSKILEKNNKFDLLDMGKKYSTSSAEYIFTEKYLSLSKKMETSMISFKKDIPNITENDIIELCSVDHFYLGKHKVF